ncbi:MAG TPA: glycosyltransferase family 2 protein, partial [Candidatus Polarisedimenticolia bacterium]|nr:glycosyltransferase family 2 protein [Candidatus Polarisedimenticolia bacterium]
MSPSEEIRPILTVVTVCRNALELLRPTVESVLAQRTPAIEYWIVDGASTDGTPEYLDKLKSRGIRSVSERDRGIADAMNKGVKLASGRWIAHLHAGDRYLPGALHGLLASAGSPADILCGSILKDEERGEVRYRPTPARLPKDMTIHHPGTFTRREVFEEIGGFDERYPNAMDYDFFLRALAAGKRFEILPETVARMASGGQSERSLWKTYRETQAIRARVLPRGWERSNLYTCYLVARGSLRRILQRGGLGGLVSWLRSRLA